MDNSIELPKLTRRGLLKGAVAATAVVAASQTGALSAVGEGVEKLIETQAQKEARKKLLEAQTQGKTVKEMVVGKEGVNLRSNPSVPSDPKSEPPQLYLNPGTKVTNLITFEGPESPGSAHGESWYALYDPTDKRDPEKARVLFGLKDKFENPQVVRSQNPGVRIDANQPTSQEEVK